MARHLLPFAAALAALAAPCAAHAQSQLIPCPAGATSVDLTPLFSVAAGATCGSRRDPNGAGPCDDGSYAFTVPAELWPSGLPYNGASWPSLWVSVNGLLAFGERVAFVNPSAFPGTSPAVIAVHLSDVDLRNSPDPAANSNPGHVFACTDLVNQRVSFSWVDVGFFDATYPPGGLNSYQVTLRPSDIVCIDDAGATRPTLGVELRYAALGWYAATSSGGSAIGRCEPGTAAEEGGPCVPAKVGFSFGPGAPAFQLEGSGLRAINDRLLAGEGTGTGGPGRFEFIVPPPGLSNCGCPAGLVQVGLRCQDPLPTVRIVPIDTVIEGTTATLDASASTDGLDRPLTFAWTQVGGPEVALTGDDTGTATFIVPEGPSALSFELEVCNENGCVDETVELVVIGLPDVVAEDIAVHVGEGALLDASASTDPQGLSLAFSWAQVSGATVVMTGLSSARPRFSAPDVPGELRFAVTVCNEQSACVTQEVRVSVGCRVGYAAEDGACVDIDECLGGVASCGDHEVCVNVPGRYACECAEGFSGEAGACVDVDECARGDDDCADDASCTNTVGGFACACMDGFSGDGHQCADVDECASGEDDCSDDATCTNTVGGFTCACRTGFVGDGRQCADIDECARGEDDCAASATCTNTSGGFTCACPSGTSGDGKTCEAPPEVEPTGVDDGGCGAGGAGGLGLVALALVLIGRRRRARS